MQNRRTFIKQSCALCMSIAGLGVISSQLSGCAPFPICKNNICKGIVSVPLTSFSDKNNLVIVRNNQMDSDILLVKASNDKYNALEMKCTHQDNPLTANSSGLFCSAHGSTFDLSGNATKEPALLPLKKFETKITDSSVEINLNKILEKN